MHTVFLFNVFYTLHSIILYLFSLIFLISSGHDWLVNRLFISFYFVIIIHLFTIKSNTSYSHLSRHKHGQY